MEIVSYLEVLNFILMASQQQTRMMSRGLLSNGGGEGLGLSCQGFEGRVRYFAAGYE